MEAIWKELFEVVQIITLFLNEYNSYWLYVDNIWSSKSTLRSSKDCGIIEYFRYQYHLIKKYIPKNENRWKRQKFLYDAWSYEMRIWVIKNLNIVTINCTGNFLYHIHKLKNIDSRKQSSTFRDLIVVEVAKNYITAEITCNLHAVNWSEDQKLLIDVSGWHLLLKDIYNISAAWKKDHSNNKRQKNLSN